MRLAPLVQALKVVMRPYLDMPFAFFGHSLGALVSFELTRQLEQDGFEPVRLFVSGRRAPSIPNPDPPIHALPDAEFIQALRRFNGTPEEVLRNTELMQLLLPILRADFAIEETFVYAAWEPLHCPISAYGGLCDDTTSQVDLAAWRDQTRDSFQLRLFAGDHFFLHTARKLVLHALSEDLALCLNRVVGKQLVR